ncbi:MAG: GNAT family N-acetyltransferase [Spirochaetia bacterium]|nr:GNAT family N-acetyltransferase [Spirochaetia bacterium]
MKFKIGTSGELKLADNEITEILKEAYLDEGFIDLNKFKTSFSPASIRNRGVIYCAREIASNEIAGMVIGVDYNSSAKLFAKTYEIEMHLLGVKPKFRNKGLAKLLIEELLESVNNTGYTKMLLWTQVNMYTAHKLYKAYGFIHNPSRDFKRGDRDFLFFEKSLQETNS